MSPTPVRTKTLFAILFGIPLLLAGLVTFVIFQFGRFGDLEVSIHEKSAGAHVGVRIPGLVVPVAMHFARATVPGLREFGFHDHADVPREVVREVLSRLADCPDGVLVDVQTADEVILVEKRAGRILVEIDTADENVHAAVPIGTARSILGVI